MTQPERIAEAKRLRAEGLSYAKIGSLLGVSGGTAHYYCRREQHYENTKAWRARNPEKVRKYYERSAARHGQARNRRKLASRRTPEGWADSIYSTVKKRAKKLGRPFSLTKQDIRRALPPDGLCPVFKIPLTFGNGSYKFNASVDCIRPELGYVPGNVAVISYRANSMKSNVGLQEVEALASWLRIVL